MNGRQAGEKYVNDKGDTILSQSLLGCALAFIPSLPVAFVVIVMIRIGGNRQPPEIKIWIITFAVMSVGFAIWLLDKRDREIREFAEAYDTEQTRLHEARERHRVESAAAAERRRLDEINARNLAAYHAQQRREEEARQARQEAAERAAAELASLENKVRVLWADFQATHNFTGEIPANVMQQRFNAEIRKRLTNSELERLSGTQSGDVRRLTSS